MLLQKTGKASLGRWHGNSVQSLLKERLNFQYKNWDSPRQARTVDHPVPNAAGSLAACLQPLTQEMLLLYLLNLFPRNTYFGRN